MRWARAALTFAAAGVTWWTVPVLLGAAAALLSRPTYPIFPEDNEFAVAGRLMLVLAVVNTVAGGLLMLYGAGVRKFYAVVAAVMLQSVLTVALVPGALRMWPITMLAVAAAGLGIASLVVSRPSGPG